MLTPEDGYQVQYDPDSLGTLDFTWQVAGQNEYEIDTVRYFIEFWADIDETVFRILMDTTTYLDMRVQSLADIMGLTREEPINFYWQVKAIDAEDSTLADDAPWTFTIPALGVALDRYSDIPEAFYLAPNYPNPFNATTTIHFGLPHMAEISLSVWDIKGRKVAELITGNFSAGRHEVTWNAAHVPAGIYVVEMKSGNFVSHRKVMLIR